MRAECGQVLLAAFAGVSLPSLASIMVKQAAGSCCFVAARDGVTCQQGLGSGYSFSPNFVLPCLCHFHLLITFFGQSIMVSPVSRDWGVRAVACLEGAPSYTMTLSAR